MRIFVRVLLGVVFFAAIGLSVYILVGSKDKESWATITALLAVVTAVISVWPSLRVLEMQEDAMRPHPMPYFDLTSRCDLLLLRVKNLGVGVAYDVQLIWDAHPCNEQGEEVTALDTISVLIPQESVSVMLGGTKQLFQIYPTVRYAGTITFKDINGKCMENRFICSADEYRKRLTYDNELPRTLRDIQDIPKELKEISNAIRDARALDKSACKTEQLKS